MLDANVDVNSRDDNGNTLMLVACQQGNKSIAKLLLRRGADVNAQVSPMESFFTKLCSVSS